MEFRNLTTFVRAAELHSFSQAAKQLGYSQSAISMQISQLEAELGTSLFDRVGKTIALTPQGLRFFEYAQNILRMAESAREEMKNASAISGQLRIAMAESICMSLFPPVLKRFRGLYPEVQLTVQTGTTEDMFRALNQNDVDIILHLDNRIFRSDLVVPVSQPVPVIFAAPAGHPLAGRGAVSLQECLGYPFILTEKGMSYRSQLDTQLAERGLELNPFLELGNTDVIARLVEQGMGLSFLPEFVVREQIARGTIARLNVEEISVSLWRQLIYHKGKWMTPAMQAMIDIIRQATEV
ncbi:MAG: LysR family transcriptional regulator [Clostridia bacterium]|nr:LysR family transcriptional regulator [Clostridia bacterium]